MESYISQNLKILRKKNQLTQQEIASALYVTPQAVSKWERGESLPDITLIPQLAKLYRVSISTLWEEPLEGTVGKFQQLTNFAHSLVDDRLVQEAIADFQGVRDIKAIVISFDFFLVLNDCQKQDLVAAILAIPDSGYLVEEFYFYLSSQQKEWVIGQLLKEEDYAALELLIPMMTRALRTRVLEGVLAEQAFDFLDELLPFLTVEQKQGLVDTVLAKGIDQVIIENYLTFFTEEQRQQLRLKQTSRHKLRDS